MLRKFFRRKNEGGFTIAEFLVAFAILAVISAIAVPSIMKYIGGVDEKALTADLVNAASNLEESKLDGGGRYPAEMPQVALTTDSVLRYTHPYDRLNYCLEIVNGETTLFKSSLSSEVTTTNCTYEYVVPSTKLTGKMKSFAPVLSWTNVANATSYKIYKNNIPVKDINGATGKTTSYTLPNMQPLEESVFHIVVVDGGSLSAQSNAVRLKAPIPTPTKPTISEVSKEIKNATTMSFTIGWNAVKYAKGYEVYDVTGATPRLLDTLGESAGTYTFDTQRGTVHKVVVRSTNTAGSSDDSNILTLSSKWDDAKIVSAKSDPATGKITFVFHETVDGKVAEGYEKVSPDYGFPLSKIRLKVSEVASGKLVLDQSNITNQKTFTTPVGVARLQHRATIIVTTATGEVLSESAPIIIDFPKPERPDVPENFTSTTGGTAVLTPNRLKWDAVTCSPSSTPEYYITHDGFNSGWITGTWSDIPSSWLAEGTMETFKIKARCVNSNGTSATSGEAATSFTTGLNTPDAPKGLDVPNRGSKAVWTASICSPTSTPEYSLSQTVKNHDDATVLVNPIKTNSYTFTDLQGGLKQNFAVAARCVQLDGSGAIVASSSWSSYSNYFGWTTMWPKPAAPIVTQVSKEYVDNTSVRFRIGWTSADRFSNGYKLYDGKTNELLSTLSGDVRETVLNYNRGTVNSVYVIGTNPDTISNKSNVLSLNDAWDPAKILNVEADPYEGSLDVTYRESNQSGVLLPDWGGNSARYILKFKEIDDDDTNDAENTYEFAATGESSFKPNKEFNRVPHEVVLTVKTSTGDKLTSAPYIVRFDPPGAPSKVVGLSVNSDGPGKIKPNRLYWDAVNCGKATPQYSVLDADGVATEWFEGEKLPNGKVYYDIQEEWLLQGFEQSFGVDARCINPAGESASAGVVDIKFTTNINTPAAVKTLTNNGINVVRWDSVAAPEGLNHEYQVSTTTFNGTTSASKYVTTDSLYVVQNLQPNKNQVVTVQVRFYNPTSKLSSAWSPAVSTTWVTPKPIPGTPVAQLDSSTVLNATTQRYKLSWAATTWAEGYRIVNDEDGRVLATTTATTFNIDLKRGIDESTVFVEAFNSSATSPKSNDLILHAPWSDAEIKTITPNRDGTVNLMWQEGTSAVPSPDWGAPSSTVDIEIRSGSKEGAVVYTATGLKTVNHVTTAFANTQTLRGVTYYVKIQVLTSTGVVLDSSYEPIKFERPTTPARVKSVRSDGTGAGPIKNDRLIWNAAVCAQPNTEAQYWAATVPPGTNYASSGTERKSIMGWTKDVTSVVIPQASLAENQGENLGFIVLARCVFTDSGDYSSYYDPYVDGDGYHEFTVGLAPPTKNPSAPTRVSTFNNTINWTAAVCGTGTSPEYQLNQTVKNGVAGTTLKTLDALSYALPGITAGANQSVQVQARCVKDSDTTKVSPYGAYSAVYSYRAPLPKPASPAINASAIVYTTATAATQIVSWEAVDHAENYVVYDGTTVLATLPPATKTYTIPLVRGSAAAKNITVKSTNFMYNAAAVTASNKLTLSAPWPTAEIDSVTSDQLRKFNITWQTGAGKARTPNWGDDASRVVLVVRNTANTADVYRTGALTTNSQITPAMPDTASKFLAYIEVTTANGEKLTSKPITIALNPPAVPAIPTGLKFTDGTGMIKPGIIGWTAVTCPTSGSTPEYLITHTDATFGNKSSGWVTGTSFTIPSAANVYWLEAGYTQAFSVQARCVSDSGESAASGKANLTTVKIVPPIPSQVTGFALIAGTNNEEGEAAFKWNAVTCPANLTAGYAFQWVTKDGVANTSMLAAGTSTTIEISNLTPGKAHRATVLGRCYDTTNTSITSTWVTSTPSAAVSWTTPIPAPVKPTLAVSGVKTNTDEKKTEGLLTWSVPEYATKTTLYRVTGTGTAVVVGTYNAPTKSIIQTVTRGTSSTYYVVAENATGSKSPESVRVNIASTWPKITLTETSFNTTTGAWAGKWATATQNPDWGNAATFQMVVRNANNSVVYTSAVFNSARLNDSMALPSNASSEYSMVVTVTTTTGVKIVSNELVNQFTSVPAVPGGIAKNSHTGIKWNAVSCAAGTTATYWIMWTTKNGVANTSTYSTTATSYALPGIVPAKAQGVKIRAKCGHPTYADSEYSNYSGIYSFTSLYAAPATAPAPTGVTLDNGGATKTTELNRVKWNHATCPTGSSRSYTVELTHKDGASYDESPWNRSIVFNSYTTTNNYFDLSSGLQQQGSARSWSVQTTCSNELGSKESGRSRTGWQTASIDAPTGTLKLSDNGWMTYTWNNLKCPANTVENNRLRVTQKNGSDIENYWTSYFVDNSASRGYQKDVPDAKYGAKQSFYIVSNCQFTNKNVADGVSESVASNTTTWIAAVRQPVITEFKGSRATKTATFMAECDYGTDFRYIWTVSSGSDYYESHINSEITVNTRDGDPKKVTAKWSTTKTVKEYNMDSYCKGVNANSSWQKGVYYGVGN